MDNQGLGKENSWKFSDNKLQERSMWKDLSKQIKRWSYMDPT